ncbi:SET domain containing [Cryptosporidium sp. chipmunk genotype I]|uniref:SET domain containing n=1 Tax=Cryptosporidium sp. chipmunk genotype I TaxID=1280935 RepID=UPI00351AAB78|nr:SET domain containing [Cryptosporidium sp. chipmunk genotype I]
MHQILDDDDWLSSELQILFKDTQKSYTRNELNKALYGFESRLSTKCAGNYVSPKIVLCSNHESNAWIAFENISKGELLLAEKPLCWVTPKIGNHRKDYSLILWKKLIQKCMNDSKLLKSLKMLFPRTQADIKRIRQESENYKIPVKEISDYFEANTELANKIKFKEALRIYLVVKYNQMSVNILPELWKNPFYWSEIFSINSLYFKSSFFDHSCSPNVARFYVGTVAVFKALRPIKIKEPLSICYIENEYIQDPLWVRNSELNFFCRCKLCQKEGGFTPDEDISKITEINKISKKLNKRCSLISRRYICMLQGLTLEERISVIEDILVKSFLPNDQVNISKAPKLVGLDASKLIGFLVHDYISYKNYEKAQYWLSIMYKVILIKDEHNIPVLILLGLISNDPETQIKHLQKAVKISKTIFGSNVKFFMKRYWLDIKHFVTMLYENKRERISFLRHISFLIRSIFSKK